MTQLETPRAETLHPSDRSGVRVVAGPGGALTRATMLAGALISATVGGVLIVAHVGTVAAAGVFFGVHIGVQGVLQLLAVHRSKASNTVRGLLSAGGVAALLLGAALFHGRADSVFLLAVSTGCGWLLRGLTMAVSVTSPSVSHVFVYDDLLNAVIVSAGLFMTAFPFSSPVQAAHVGGAVLLATGVTEAAAAARRGPRTLRAID
ncbi:hypothetical protein ACWDYK_38630 [Streptomyces anthocyanicus]|uniref:hypothetical protein n=1 Tax=Streptomyces anthocyanicus TaxID=68174 RepID=UPI002F912023|nr:hypothetical protein OHA15_40740 [Streptomyces anthocyanicus]